MSDAEITRLRDEIADVDRDLVALVVRRLQLAERVGVEKKILGRPLRDAEREERVLARLLDACSRHGISEGFAEGLARLLIDESVRREDATPSPEPSGRRVLVVGGAGRMGRWLARYLRGLGHDVRVHDPAGSPAGFAPEADLGKGVAAADIVAVSVPISSAADVLRRVAAHRPKALVFDLTSLKAPIQEELRGMASSGLTVASVHPLFGPDHWPPSTGTIAFSDCGNARAVQEAKALFRPSGANLLDISLDRHDEFMAFLLSLSHLCVLTFARAAADGPSALGGVPPPAGTTFSRLSAVARSLLEDSPDLLRDIQALNPHTPAVRDRLREALDEWERATDSDDPKTFLALIDQARAYLRGAST